MFDQNFWLNNVVVNVNYSKLMSHFLCRVEVHFFLEQMQCHVQWGPHGKIQGLHQEGYRSWQWWLRRRRKYFASCLQYSHVCRCVSMSVCMSNWINLEPGVCVFVLEWNSWTGGPCQSSCGSGLKTFSRTCQDVANNVVADNSNCELLSPDKSFETRECEENLPACPGVTKWRSQ